MNPILQQIARPQNNMLDMLSGLKQQNPNIIMQQMMQNNPQFRSFVQQNQGLNAGQIAQKYGVDINKLNSLLR